MKQENPMTPRADGIMGFSIILSGLLYPAISNLLLLRTTRLANEIPLPSYTADTSIPRRISSLIRATSCAARADVKPRFPT